MSFLDFFRYDWLQNAFIAGTIAAILASLIGYFVVLRSQAFAGEALSDLGFAGATGAALLGVGALFGMLVFSLLAALGMGSLGERIRGRDVEIGMVLSFALGLGALFITLSTQTGINTSVGVGILFGSILTVSRENIWLSLIVGALILAILLLIFRPLLFATVDPELAATRGVPVRLLSIVFLTLLGATITMMVQVVGVLLVSALLIAPAATALLLTRRPLHTLLLATALGLLFIWGGLLLSIIGTGIQLPASFYITTLAALFYFATVALNRAGLLGNARRLPKPTPCHDCEEHHPAI